MRGLTLLAAAVVLLLAGTPAQALPGEEPPDVTDGQLTRSVTAVQLAGSVTVMPLEDSVTPLQQREEDGELTTVTVSSDVLFDFGSDAVEAEAVARLRTLAAEVPDGAAVTVVGHTDGIGSDAANDALSLRRAEAVAAVLRQAAPSLQISTEGRGEREPVAEETQGGEDDPAGRAANRRVVISFVT